MIYYIYSTTNASLNFDTLSEIESDGTLVNSGSTDVNSFTVSNLTSDTFYTFNVVVQDQAGNKNVYAPISRLLGVGEYLVLFDLGDHNGKWDDATGNAKDDFDADCAAASLPKGATNAFGVASFTSLITIANLPTVNGFSSTNPLFSNSYKRIIDSYDDFAGGAVNLHQTLLAAGVTNEVWWTGSETDGTLNAASCSEWNSSSNGVSGRLGSHISADSARLSSIGAACNLLRPRICVATIPND